MNTVDLSAVRKTADEELARQYLALRGRGKCGSPLYQCIENEMRARNLLRSDTRLETFYTSRSSRFDARPMLFAGSSFR